MTADQIFRLFYIVHQLALLEPETQINGVVVIMDFDGLSLKQVSALSPSFSMKLLGFIQDAMPLRLKEVHMVKQPFIFNMVWAIFKPLIREKLKKRVSELIRLFGHVRVRVKSFAIFGRYGSCIKIRWKFPVYGLLYLVLEG